VGQGEQLESVPKTEEHFSVSGGAIYCTDFLAQNGQESVQGTAEATSRFPVHQLQTR
jgi:hypothetical protein